MHDAAPDQQRHPQRAQQDDHDPGPRQPRRDQKRRFLAGLGRRLHRADGGVATRRGVEPRDRAVQPVAGNVRRPRDHAVQAHVRFPFRRTIEDLQGSRQGMQGVRSGLVQGTRPEHPTALRQVAPVIPHDRSQVAPAGPPVDLVPVAHRLAQVTGLARTAAVRERGDHGVVGIAGHGDLRGRQHVDRHRPAVPRAAIGPGGARRQSEPARDVHVGHVGPLQGRTVPQDRVAGVAVRAPQEVETQTVEVAHGDLYLGPVGRGQVPGDAAGGDVGGPRPRKLKDEIGVLDVDGDVGAGLSVEEVRFRVDDAEPDEELERQSNAAASHGGRRSEACAGCWAGVGRAACGGAAATRDACCERARRKDRNAAADSEGSPPARPDAVGDGENGGLAGAAGGSGDGERERGDGCLVKKADSAAAAGADGALGEAGGRSSLAGAPPVRGSGGLAWAF